MSTPPNPCRLHCIIASHAPVAVVFRRRPSHTWHVLKLNLQDDTIESGGWMNGSLYPERCAISPDGRLLAYFALQAHNHWQDPWSSFFAVSKLPWLTALVAWPTMGTYTTGSCFEDSSTLLVDGCNPQTPHHGAFQGTVKSVRMPPYGNLISMGWQLRTPMPQRDSLSAREWSEYRTTFELRKSQPVGGWVLFQLPSVHQYAMESMATGRIEQPDWSWADWDHRNRLVVATRHGVLQIHNMRRWPDSLEWHDVKSPEWSRNW